MNFEFSYFIFALFRKTEDDSTQGFQQQQLLQHASNVDEKDIILAAEETHAYYR